MQDNLGPNPGHVGVFQTTQWSLVLAAQNGSSPEAEAALEELCRTYSRALYAYLRRTGHGIEDAQDLAQEFLSQFIHKQRILQLQEQRGRFRSFLLAFLKNFLADERRRANAQKRGGGQWFISLDACAAEECHVLAFADGLTPDQIYDRCWAQTVMTRALERLREENGKRGQTALFDQLKDLHPGERGQHSHTEIAAVLGLTTQAVKNAVQVFRRRYAECMRSEVAQTVADPSEVNAELKNLVELFAG